MQKNKTPTLLRLYFLCFLRAIQGNETANPRANPVPLGVGPGKRPVPLVARSAVFAAAKKMKSCVF